MAGVWNGAFFLSSLDAFVQRWPDLFPKRDPKDEAAEKPQKIAEAALKWVSFVEETAFGDPNRFEQIMNMPLTEFLNLLSRHRVKSKKFTQLTDDATADARIYFLHLWRYGML